MHAHECTAKYIRLKCPPPFILIWIVSARVHKKKRVCRVSSSGGLGWNFPLKHLSLDEPDNECLWRVTLTCTCYVHLSNVTSGMVHVIHTAELTYVYEESNRYVSLNKNILWYFVLRRHTCLGYCHRCTTSQWLQLTLSYLEKPYQIQCLEDYRGKCVYHCLVSTSGSHYSTVGTRY